MTQTLEGIRITDASKIYKRSGGGEAHAVSEVSVTINPHEFVCIVGPSGCGKTTLLQMVAGLTEVSSGEISVNRKKVEGPGPDRGLVFQKDSVFPWMRVLNNVTYGLRCQGMPKRKAESIARHFLEEVGLDHVVDSWPKELSGGMLKRVAIATVFASAPPTLLLDEPFGALDYVTRMQLHSVLLDLWAENKPTVLFVTHDVDEALTLADRILVMNEGRIVDDRRIEFQRPRGLETLALPEAIEHKEALLRHLGLEDRVGGEPR